MNSNNQDLDKSDMRGIIVNFPNQFKFGIEAARAIKLKARPNDRTIRSGGRAGFEKIFVCGMGGSALAGLLAGTWLRLEKKHCPIHVLRQYDLPKIRGKKPLIVCVSYSGNTEETISNYRRALKNKYQTISLSVGGRLKSLCEKNKTPFVAMPSDDIPPRLAVGYMFGALAAILEKSGFAENLSQKILAGAKKIRPIESEKYGRALAEKIGGKIPIIYASSDYGSLAYNWKIQLNESAKTPAFCNFFPELNHNEMLGFNFKEYADKFHILILKSDKEHPRIAKRVNLTAELLRKKGILLDIVSLTGKSNFEKIFNALILGHWTSYYAALQKGIDPTPIEMIEEFKKKMA